MSSQQRGVVGRRRLDQRRAARPATDHLRGQRDARLDCGRRRTRRRSFVDERPEPCHVLPELTEDQIASVHAKVAPRADRPAPAAEGRAGSGRGVDQRPVGELAVRVQVAEHELAGRDRVPGRAVGVESPRCRLRLTPSRKPKCSLRPGSQLVSSRCDRSAAPPRRSLPAARSSSARARGIVAGRRASAGRAAPDCRGPPQRQRSGCCRRVAEDPLPMLGAGHAFAGIRRQTRRAVLGEPELRQPGAVKAMLMQRSVAVGFVPALSRRSSVAEPVPCAARRRDAEQQEARAAAAAP